MNQPVYRGIRIEANVTFRCNAICEDCNKAVGLAKFDDTDMTVEQMKGFVDQIIEQDVYVSRFTFCGGEPILNRNLQGLIDEVARLKGLRVGRILTNGLKATENLRSRIKLPSSRFHWVVNQLDDIEDPLSGKHNPKKRPNRSFHKPFWVSPDDVGMEAGFEHCTVKGWCGVGLDPAGWSMCGKAVMFGKLLGIDEVAKKDVDIISHVRTGIEDICRHCQYGLVNGPSDEDVILKRVRSGEIPRTSQTFKDAFERNREQHLVQIT